MSRTFLVLLAILSSALSIGQDTTKIELIPKGGHLHYSINDSLAFHEQIKDLLDSSNCDAVVKDSQKFKRKNIGAQIFATGGLSFTLVWLINEIFNDEFHLADADARMWRIIVIGPSLVCDGGGFILFRSARKSLYKAIEGFNQCK